MISAPAAPAAPSTQRKRQRLDQLVDRIALLVATPPPAPHASSATSPDVPDALLMSRLRQASSSVFSFEHVVLNHNHHHHHNNNNNNNSRSNKNNNCSPCQEHSDASDAEEDSVFSVDSPSAISFSPLSFDDDFRHHFRMPLVDASTPLNLSKTSRRCPYSSGSSSSSSSSSSNGNGGGGGGDSCNRRRRARSDSDLRNRLEQLRPPPLMGRSVKRNSSDSTDDSWSPLDLSVRSSSSQTPSSSCASSCASSCTSTDFLETPSRAAASKLLTRSISLSQYLSAEYPCGDVSADDGAAKTAAAAPLIRNTTAAFSCEQCGQGFDVHDRLVKHLASRHKTQQQRNGASAGEVVKGYQCDVCQRPFARSDMLTRHMRLHTGLKPYTCRICGQVFSRSDHLSTHQRTHTGEKPYRCPQCAYAACRRDMITRHLRTHARSEDLTDAADPPRKDST